MTPIIERANWLQMAEGVGSRFTVNWMKVAITTILATVPNPGFSRNGIQIRRTMVLMKNVHQPNATFVRKLNPWAKTLHGAFPMCATTNNPSPIPKSAKPIIKIVKRCGDNDQVFSALHGVCGIVRESLNLINASY